MKISLKELVPVSVVAILCAICLALVYALTKERTDQNIKIEKLRMITAVMTADFDNNIYTDVKNINYTDESGTQRSTDIYRARKAGIPTGVVLLPITTTGYNGAIQLSIGIKNDGTLLGIQVLAHQESEGWGADIHQNNTDWLKIFTNESLTTTPIKQWAIKKDAGHFDQISGATITSRSAVNAIKNSLQLYMVKQSELFSD